MNAVLKFKIDHSHKNIINLESSQESFNSSVGSDFFNNVMSLDEDDMTPVQKNLASRQLDDLKAGSGDGIAPRITFHSEKQCVLKKEMALKIREHLKNVKLQLDEKKKKNEEQ